MRVAGRLAKPCGSSSVRSVGPWASVATAWAAASENWSKGLQLRLASVS
jgi:hypothetical protein